MDKKNGHQYQVTVLMMATTTDNAGLRNSVDSLKQHGYDYKILGMGAEWKGWRMRMQLYRDEAKALSKLDPSAIVVCMDAYDALSMRPSSGLVETFLAFEKPLVLSLEPFCGGNCIPIRDWWKTHGVSYLTAAGFGECYKPADRYVNGGLLMGYAYAVAELYDWILKTPEIDDQRGIAQYALAHRDGWAPDILGRLFKNKIYGEQLSDDDLAQKGAYFAHFPGMVTWSTQHYERAVKKVLKRPSGVKSKNMGKMDIFVYTIIAIVCTCLMILMFAWILLPNQLKFVILRPFMPILNYFHI